MRHSPYKDDRGKYLKGISKNLVFYGLNPSPFSRREGYKEFLEVRFNK